MTRLSDAQRRLLLRVAREAVELTVRMTEPEPVVDQADACHGGAFVTLRIGEALRGCVGQVEGDDSRVALVSRVASAAATGDPRFAPLRIVELESVRIEVSVLGPLEPCRGPDDLEVGRHGVTAEVGSRRGLLLPQVAVECGWDPKTFVAQVCRKAGLSAEAWKQRGTLRRFEADVFSEGDEGFRDSRRP